MARQGISKEQVYTAASELREEGITPTVQAVRERIGSGSFSTISAHLAEWKAENAAQAPADIPAMPEKVQTAFQQIWATAARSAQEDVETQREALEAMRREMDKERAAMAEEIERLEKDLEETGFEAQWNGKPG
jgi:SOS-response transcriptional repressor LexA